MLALYALTICLGAGLLFLVQPLVARLLLPLLGGSPAVWNTCMVFFQAALLGGYLYAHVSTRWLGPRRQALLHAAVVAVPLIALPIALPERPPPAEGSPIPWLLGALAAAVGLPFFVVATAGPVLQRWVAATDHAAARDPYFLYAASNAGSLLGLLAYPLLLEPLLTLRQQSLAFTIGYGAFAAATLACAIVVWRRPAPGQAGRAGAEHRPAPAEPAGAVAVWRQRGWWVLLAFVPSSLMLGTTQYLSTDIAAIPLLWVVPLAVYLITFIVAFASRPPRVEYLSRLVPIIAVALALAFLLQARRPAWALILLHLAMLLFGALLCHVRLAASRPPAHRLTEFYLLIALGGVLGGVFNSLVAPIVFDEVLEYPIAIVLACLMRPRRGPWTWRWGWIDVALPAALAAYLDATPRIGWALRSVGADVATAVAFGVPALACFLASRRVPGFAAGVAVLLGAAVLFPGGTGRPLLTERTFFGVHRVTLESGGRIKALYHGTTLHGAQMLGPERSFKPRTYYHPFGPIGKLFRVYGDDPRLARVGVVGLGVGSLAAYARPEQRFTFFEIDPEVARIARDSGHFTFLDQCQGACEVRLGDGRLSLAREPDGAYGLIVLDAFSSDAIPVHLLTREAVALYRRKLRPDGLLAFHISNRHLDLWPVLGAIMHDLGMHGYIADDPPDPRFEDEAKSESLWVVLVNRPEHGAALLREPPWQPFLPPPGGPLWTDEYSNVLSVFHWADPGAAGDP